MVDYYEKLYVELVKLLNECPNAAECFLCDEHVFSGRDWYSGEYWRVTLPEIIEYAHNIALAKEQDKKKKRKAGVFFSRRELTFF